MSTQLLTPAEAAAFLNVTKSALATWRARGLGPPFVRLTERVVRYDERDLLAWLESRKEVA